MTATVWLCSHCTTIVNHAECNYTHKVCPFKGTWATAIFEPEFMCEECAACGRYGWDDFYPTHRLEARC